MNSAKIYNWGILSTGMIAKKMAIALKRVPQSKLYAVGSRDLNKAGAFAKQFHFETAYGSYEELADDPKVDIVYIATPHNLHYANTILCLEHGKNVLCEKPFAVNGKQVREMIKKAKDKNLFLMEAMWNRFLPHIIKAKEIIEAGSIGKVNLLVADFCMKPIFDPADRKFNKELIGGSLMDIGIYPVFLALFLLGNPSDFKAVAGIGETGVDYNCSISFSYEDEKLAVLYSSFIADTGVKAVIYGEKGKIIFDDKWFTPGNLTWIDAHKKKHKIKCKAKGNGYHLEAIEVIDCLNRGTLQSDKMNWDKSLELIDMLDALRKQCGIVYPGHD